MYQSGYGNNGNNGNEGNGINNMYINNNLRGYSSRHSDYDNAFNMDFEYSYLELMSNFGILVSRTYDMYSNIETRISSMIETQNERRRYVTRRRERSRSNRDALEHPVANDNDNTSILEDSHSSNEAHNENGSQERDVRGTTGVRNTGNVTRNRTTVGSGSGSGSGTRGTAARNARTSLFDMGSVIYSIPRTVLLNPNNDNAASNRRRTGGLTISEIEEHTEIMTYGTIPPNEIKNTECPITRETFTPESVVLAVKHCKHCFVPFRMMTWLETHSTCPLCRENVVNVRASHTNDSTGTNTNTNTETTINNTENPENEDSLGNTDNTDNADNTDNRNTAENISISNIFNTLLQNRSNDFNNLSIDNVNNNSIVFSFDVPASRESSQNSNSNPFIFPEIERLMNSAISRNNEEQDNQQYNEPELE